MRYRFEITRRETGYRGFFRIDRLHVRHDLFSGGETDIVRECFERGNAAAVLPYDPVEDRVVLIEQFRIGALDSPGGPWVTEVAAGIIETGESPSEVARRESIEETGCELADLEPVYEFVLSPGGCSERVYLYCGRVNAAQAAAIGGLAHEGEDIRVLSVDFEEAMRWLREGRIDSAISIVALQWLALNRRELRERWNAAGLSP